MVGYGMYMPTHCRRRELHVSYILDILERYLLPSCFNCLSFRHPVFIIVVTNHQFKDGASYGVYISQLIRIARVCNHVTDFNARNKCLTFQLLQQAYRYHKLRKTFSKFYRRHYVLISKFNVGLKTLLREGLSEPEFYGDLVDKFKKLIERNDFSFHFRKIIIRYRRYGYNLNVMRPSACLVLTQSGLITMLLSLIVRRWVGCQTL